MNLQTDQASSFHKRAHIVIKDIMSQLGIDESKIKMAANFTETIKTIPPFAFSLIGIPQEKVSKTLNELEPFLKIVKDQEDPLLFIMSVPEDKMTYFINQVITRLEWVKNGNESGHPSE